jgi:hypothetical protein
MGSTTVSAAALLAALTCPVVACGQPPAPRSGEQAVGRTPPSSAPVDPADVAFGYTNDTGTKLLVLQDDDVVKDSAKAGAMDTAICSEGRVFPIRFLHFQKATPASNGRQSPGNFSNDQGHLFELTGQAEPGETCMVVPPGFVQRFPIARNDFTTAARAARLDEFDLKRKDQRRNDGALVPFPPAGALATDAVARIERQRGRGVNVYWLLHSVGQTQQVAAVEFNPAADSLLGGLVLVEGAQLSFFDMPASLKEGRERGGCWRVDDECAFNVEEMDVPAVLGAPGERLVFFTGGGPEGQVIVLFQARDGKLIELKRSGRYQAPV